MAFDPPAGGRATDFLITAAEWNKINGAFVDVARVYDATGTAVDVVNTTTETSLWSKTIEANLLGTNGGLHLRVGGDYLNDSGSARTFTLRVKFGGTTFFDDVSASIAASASRAIWELDIWLANLNATNAQHLNGEFAMADRSAPTTGLGNLAGAGLMYSVIGSAPTNPTIDTTAAQTFDVTVQHSAANANLSFRKKYARLLYEPLP